MLLFKKVIFIHIPKSGGSWVRKLLLKHGARELSYPHDILRNHKLRCILTRPKSFCFIRHPAMMVYSLWRHWSGDPNCRKNNLNRNLSYMWDKKVYGEVFARLIDESSAENTFQNFTSEAPGIITEMLSSYTEGVTYIGRSETLREDLEVIFKKIGIKNSDSLFSEIRSSVPENVSKGELQRVPLDLVQQFMEQEPACEQYDYSIDMLKDQDIFK